MRLLTEEHESAKLDRNDQLQSKGLTGEVADEYVDYKREMLQGFVDLLNEETDAGDSSSTVLDRLVSALGKPTGAALASFALEFAEGRANLNREQAFFYLALYQYALSREQLLETYLGATTEKHPDVRRRRALQTIAEQFPLCGAPAPSLPHNYEVTERDQRA